MKVHLVHKVYSNNVSVVEKVFGSRKRAQEFLDYNFAIDERDGWERSALINNIYLSSTGSYALVWKLIKNGDERMAMRFYIETREVA